MLSDLLLLTFPVLIFSFFHLVLVVQFPLLEDTVLVLGVGLHTRIVVLDVVHFGLDVNLFLFMSCDVSFICERVLNICVEQKLIAVAFDGAHGCVGLGKRRHRSMEVHQRVEFIDFFPLLHHLLNLFLILKVLLLFLEPLIVLVLFMLLQHFLCLYFHFVVGLYFSRFVQGCHLVFEHVFDTTIAFVLQFDLVLVCSHMVSSQSINLFTIFLVNFGPLRKLPMVHLTLPLLSIYLLFLNQLLLFGHIFHFKLGYIVICKRVINVHISGQLAVQDRLPFVGIVAVIGYVKLMNR